MSRDIRITPYLGSTVSGLYPEIKFRGISQSFITLKVDDDGSVVYAGTYGTLFNITDSKDGLLHSVNDISGLPILSVYSYDYVQMGKWDKYSLVVNSDKVGVGLTGPSTKLHVYSTQSGAFRLQDTTQAAGYVLVSDANGVGSWTSSGGLGGSMSGTIQIINGQVTVNTPHVTYTSKIFLSYTGVTQSGWTMSVVPANTLVTFTDQVIPGVSFTIEAWDGLGVNDVTNDAWIHWLIIN